MPVILMPMVVVMTVIVTVIMAVLLVVMVVVVGVAAARAVTVPLLAQDHKQHHIDEEADGCDDEHHCEQATRPMQCVIWERNAQGGGIKVLEDDWV